MPLRSLRVASYVLSEADKAQLIDLRPFMDPCPIVVNELMPLRRVYKLFNTVGLRHLAVVDCREQARGACLHIWRRASVCPSVRPSARPSICARALVPPSHTWQSLVHRWWAS